MDSVAHWAVFEDLEGLSTSQAQTAVRYPGHGCTGNPPCDLACSVQCPPLGPQPSVVIFLPLL